MSSSSWDLLELVDGVLVSNQISWRVFSNTSSTSPVLSLDASVELLHKEIIASTKAESFSQGEAQVSSILDVLSGRDILD